ncbi:iron chaperone [Mariniflexile jejuense]|uniref:Iron chaperone n=1 Tax=Mariniflexile jejuense TaxID=1173582 RepID=A0ABW3JGA2_9FLAO
MNTTIETVDDYINNFSSEIQEKLNTIRKIILDNALDVVESISYGMPAYKTHKKPLVYFAAYAKHIGFYATPTGHIAFAEELKGYKQGKGSVQFPIDAPLPFDLITRIVKFRVNENVEKFNKN